MAALLIPLLLLVGGTGFGVHQLARSPLSAASDGTSTVSAMPGVITITPRPASTGTSAWEQSPDATAPASGSTAPSSDAVDGGGGLAAIPVPTKPLTPRAAAPTEGSGGGDGGARNTAPAVAARPLAPAAQAPVGGSSPFASSVLYVDPAGDAAKAVAAMRSSDPAGAATLDRLAGQPHADWFGADDPAVVRTRVADRVRAIRGAGALPVLVAYAIPGRDCGGQSAGGTADQAGYQAWVTAFAAGLGAGPAAVIVEPDALAQVDCLSAAATAARYAMLSFAVEQLAAVGATVYLDAGHASWHSAAVMAARLRLAGVDKARGFSLNVSNFDETADETAYGDALVAALGGTAHYVVDTSRNGRGPAGDGIWCNPAGRGLGVAPTGATGNERADAFLWIKIPGESDGACNGGPAAGQWWLDYALGLADRSV